MDNTHIWHIPRSVGCALLSAVLGCNSSGGDGGATEGGAAEGGAVGGDGGMTGGDGGTADGDAGPTTGTNPILNPSFETPAAANSPWISGAEDWTATGSTRRVTDPPNIITDGSAAMRVGAGFSSMNDLCSAGYSSITQPNVDLSHATELTFDWRVVGTMTYTSLAANIDFDVSTEETKLWSKTYTPPSIGYANLDERGTETVKIPSGSKPGDFSVSIMYVGASGVDVEECVIAYVDNFRVR